MHPSHCGDSGNVLLYILIVVKVTVGSKEICNAEFLFYQKNKYYFDSRELHEASIKALRL